MIDIIYLAHNRLEFTRESLRQLGRNTDWSKVRRLIKYVDVDQYGRDDGTQNLVVEFHPPAGKCLTSVNHFGGPVNVMNRYIEQEAAPGDVFVKLDNDVIVPPDWLARGLQVMEECPGLDLLGIEPPASRTAAPWANGKRVATPESVVDSSQLYAPCDSIGGLGFMRADSFLNRPPMKQHSTYGGFTDWQHYHSRIGPHGSNGERDRLTCGWIVPPLKLFLLDRLPFDPWFSLSLKYIAKGWQRPWTPYPPSAECDLWGWWQFGTMLEDLGIATPAH